MTMIVKKNKLKHQAVFIVDELKEKQPLTHLLNAPRQKHPFNIILRVSILVKSTAFEKVQENKLFHTDR